MALHTPARRIPGLAQKYTPKDLELRLFGTVEESFVDGPGIRYVIFTQGCPHGCIGCHNPLSHPMEGGTPSSTSEQWQKILSHSHLDGITFSGGEPFLWARELSEIGRAARDRGLTVMTYTGFLYEKLLEMAKNDSSIHDLLSCTNYLVDGPFVLAERDLSLKYRGSRNQRILDITCYPNSTNAAEAQF